MIDLQKRPLPKCSHCPGYRKCPAYRRINGEDYCVKIHCSMEKKGR